MSQLRARIQFQFSVPPPFLEPPGRHLGTQKGLWEPEFSDRTVPLVNFFFSFPVIANNIFPDTGAGVLLIAT
jgi:hypothetical protein